MENTPYYLGLDIGTNSVGYAAADKQYRLCKFKGEPVWGATLFEEAHLAEERRGARTARRRLDRRQQRVALLEELFAMEIGKVDPNFFLRRRESALFAEDSHAGVSLFNGDMADAAYHKRYPTIHHLIVELMESHEPHDVRLVYLACAWLVAHRGHFLFDAADGQINDFGEVYRSLCDYLRYEYECGLPWGEDVSANTLLEVLTARLGIKRKQAYFIERVYGGKKIPKAAEEAFPYDRSTLVALLCGGTVSLVKLFQNEDYSELGSVNLGMDEENFLHILSDLDGDGDSELLRKLRAVYDCACLTQTLDGCANISEAKIKVYEQHKQDLAFLKHLVRTYVPEKYNLIFRAEGVNNYVAYSGNVKSCPVPEKVTHAKKEDFCKFLTSQLKGLTVEEKDQTAYVDMLDRLDQNTFLPKQRESDNRVIPQQLYYAELDSILTQAVTYLPMLAEVDESGLSKADKIRHIFHFRIPYYVGPLNQASPNSWVQRKSGKIYPWNFREMVDLDATEEQFIQRMTNRCTYLPGEEVLPANSLLYQRYTVLNEINNLTINGHSIPVAVKQELVTDLFEQSSRKVTLKAIRSFLAGRGYLMPEDELGGVDQKLNSSLGSCHSFRRLLTNGTLTQDQVEEIIRRAAYSEDKSRMDHWLGRTYPHLSKEDRRYILHLNLKEFGRLSARLLTGIYHTDPDTGEAHSILDLLWQTNENLMQLLSERYSFRQQIEAFAASYYAQNPQTLSERLDDMYLSNAAKRPIIRSLKITEEVVKAMGRVPEKIFVEMARGGEEKSRSQRTRSRYQQLMDLYDAFDTVETRKLREALGSMGEMVNNRLQSDKLFLYFMQMGRCMYTGEPIELSQLGTKLYDIDHIYPQSKVQDDSILNNKVLCLSSANGNKSDHYPIDAQIRQTMQPFWDYLLKNGLMVQEKYDRLTRATGFTDDELHQFISRQMVETRQSTKAVTQLLKERYPDTQIVYVKAGLVSEFRKEYQLFKSRAVNDLHHVKDAYLNVVVGNVYHERFTKRWFDVHQNYSLKVKSLFGHQVVTDGTTIWRGEEDVALVRKMAAKNAAHLTYYAFCRKGGLFDQQPVKAKAGLVPRKANSPLEHTEKYGGYNKTTASFYLLASYTLKKKKDLIFVPVELMYADRVMADPVFAMEYVTNTIVTINGGKPVEQVQLLLGGRRIKINTILEVDGLQMILRGKSGGGRQLITSPCTPLILGGDMERYVKRLEVFHQKQIEKKMDILPDSEHDHITPEENLALYDLLCHKLTDSIFNKCPGNIAQPVLAGREQFCSLSVVEQITCLLNIVAWFGKLQTCDLELIGGVKKAGSKVLNARLAAWKKLYHEVRIVDVSASGLFRSRSENLLVLL